MMKTILIVDNSDSTRQRADLLLQQSGYEVIQAKNSRDGLNILKTNQIHLVIGDINLPSINGLSFMRTIRGLPEYKSTPIVALSNGLLYSSLEQAQDSSVNAWLNKPLDTQELMDVVSRLIPDSVTQ